MPLSTAIAGWAAAKIDPGVALAVLGAIVAGLSIAQSFNPAILKVEDKGYLDRMATDPLIG